ncbi:MAG TPA: phosphate acyltransferase [Candidatus Cloacimonadota bacterium]|jgi:phosphate butyryltransferase|nr:phosphate acyltransferase [Candidatus Cloacimonadales bacterium]HPK41285.1 phosphate acyltransferase [Candidatus Cloacimonadota bacterium]HPY96326.1 phosphate acyltransferase [Candidatus Cloacimonadota bacterium]HQB40975.1 phosphate acyltransferase [Candidatus Cloacimonadota bacterium]
MSTITRLSQLVERVKSLPKKRIAIAVAEDQNTLTAINEATQMGFIHPIMLGNKDKIIALCEHEKIDYSRFEILHFENDIEATKEAVRLVREGMADVLMKGLVNTDKFLKAVLDKEKGLLPPKTVMSYVCAIEVPKYKKLLFVSDTAVLPFPDLDQKIAMVKYAVNMANKFGIEKPKVALLSAAEKVSPHFQSTLDYAAICKMVERKQLPDCTIDGPVDLFLACDPESVEIKGIPTPLAGEADVLICPSIEASNIFYKGLMLFAEGELAGLIQGTIKPVVVMSRSESAKSKLYCIALSCLMSEE